MILLRDKTLRIYSPLGHNQLYNRQYFELLGIGFQYLSIVALITISLSGSIYYLFKFGTASEHHQTSSPATLFTTVNSSGGGNRVLDRIENLLTTNLCSHANNSTFCQFEPRHLPPFLQTISNTNVVKFRKIRHSTVLVITFNRPTTYYVTPLVHALYGRIFEQILYCGPSQNATDFRDGIAEYFKHDQVLLNYFEARYLAYQHPVPQWDGYGENNYFCFNLAVEFLEKSEPAFKPSGVFVLADDAMFSFWNIGLDSGRESLNLDLSYSLPFPRLIYDTETLKACDMRQPSDCNRTNPWLNWPENYQIPTSDFYHDLVHRASKLDESQIFSRCLERISSRAGGVFRVMTGYADIFYVARKDFSVILPMFELASKHKVFQEVAVPTVFACLDPKTTGFIDDTADNTNTVEQRKSPWQAYDAQRLLMHPFKFSNLVRAMFGDEAARNSRMLGICLYCMLAQYSKYLSLLVLASF